MSRTMMLVLPVPKFCGRGIRFKKLDGDEKRQATERAARAMSGGAKVDLTDFVQERKWQSLLLIEYVKAMLVGVTEQKGFASVDALLAAQATPGAVTWRKLNIEVLDTDTSGYSFRTLFSADSVDEEALIGVYTRTHGYQQEELDAIVGKALPVSED